MVLAKIKTGFIIINRTAFFKIIPSNNSGSIFANITQSLPVSFCVCVKTSTFCCRQLLFGSFWNEHSGRGGVTANYRRAVGPLPTHASIGSYSPTPTSLLVTTTTCASVSWTERSPMPYSCSFFKQEEEARRMVAGLLGPNHPLSMIHGDHTLVHK